MISNESYFLNEELVECLKLWEKNFPKFFQFESIGKSSLGEEIWLITLTELSRDKTPEEKPGFWIEANIHASEVTGTQGALYFCEKMLESTRHHDKESLLSQQLLKKITYYILPRFSPDGARAFFKNKNSFRSSPLITPQHYKNSFFQRKDLDGDGEITLMRWEDPAGPYKLHPDIPEVLIPRLPDDFYDGTQKFYHVLPEGEFLYPEGWSSLSKEIQRSKNYDAGYDFNRQSPSFFIPEGQQKGAGEVPLQFPETRAVANAFRKRKNIFASNSYHTYGGFIIKTPANLKDSEIPLEDFFLIQKAGAMIAEKTNYTLHNGNNDFVYTPGVSIPGTYDEWYYLHQGVMGLTIEYWDLWQRADMKWSHAVEKYESLSSDNMKKLWSWAQKNLELEDYFLPWKKLVHPQLGFVEIGGFKTSFFLLNPPIKFLKEELEKVFQGTLAISKLSPQLEVVRKSISKVDQATFKLELKISNVGYMPTYGTKQALLTKAISERPVLNYENIKLSQDFQWLHQPIQNQLYHLQGFSEGTPRISPFFGNNFSHQQELVLEWVIKGSGSFDVVIDFCKAGTLREHFEF